MDEGRRRSVCVCFYCHSCSPGTFGEDISLSNYFNELILFANRLLFFFFNVTFGGHVLCGYSVCLLPSRLDHRAPETNDAVSYTPNELVLFYTISYI